MSKDDWETSQTLLNPYVEIGKGKHPDNQACVNASTFDRCSGHLMPPSTDIGPNTFDESVKIYSIYGVVGRTVVNPHGTGAYLNIDEPPISRTLMGFLEDAVLKKNLPEVHRELNS